MSLEDLLRRLRSGDRPALLVTPALGAGASGRIGLLAGSFDPPTAGHLALAEEGLRAGLHVVVLVYSVATVPKEPGSSPPLLSEATRIGALQRLRLRPGIAMGLASHGLLVDQVTAAREVFPGAELTVLLGSDKALQLLDPRWYVDRDDALDRLLGAADVRYVERAGSEGLVAAALARPEHRRWAARFTRLPSGPFADISSAQVRARLRRGEDVGAWVPREILTLLPVRP